MALVTPPGDRYHIAVLAAEAGLRTSLGGAARRRGPAIESFAQRPQLLVRDAVQLHLQIELGGSEKERRMRQAVTG
jgi:hypothetical protein